MPKRNVYDLLSRNQIIAMLEVIEAGTEDIRQRRDSENDYTQEDIDGINAKLERAQQAYDLIAADTFPQHATPAALTQLSVMDIRNATAGRTIVITPGVRAALEIGTKVMEARPGDRELYVQAQEALGEQWEVDEYGPSHSSTDLIRAARAVLGFFGEEGGWEPGHFEKFLIQAILNADNENLILLVHAFPAYGLVIQDHYRAAGADGLRALLPAKIQ